MLSAPILVEHDTTIIVPVNSAIHTHSLSYNISVILNEEEEQLPCLRVYLENKREDLYIESQECDLRCALHGAVCETV